MDEARRLLIKNYFANMTVEAGMLGYQRVYADWRDMNYVPGYNKFYLICDGEGWLKIGDEEYYPKPGQLFFMPEGTMQSYSTISPHTFTKYWCHFNASVGDLRLTDLLTLPHFIDVGDMTAPITLFKRLIDSSHSLSLTAGLSVKAALLELVAYYLNRAEETSGPNGLIEGAHLDSGGTLGKLNRVTRYIDKHLSENIQVEQLAQLLHLHPNYFIRFFKRNMGLSPIHYVNKKRIDRAKRILETTEDTLTSIGDKVGIRDSYYLSKLFKEMTGYTPTEYRKFMGKPE